MNLTRRGLFGLIASLAGLFVAAKQRASATASTAKSKRPSHDYDYPRTYTYEYDPSQPLKSITGDGRVWHFTYDANARIIDCCR